VSQTAGVAIERANPREIPMGMLLLCGVFILLGVLAFALGERATVWRAFHVNYLFWASLAQGGVVLSCIFTIVGATWPGPVKRIAEGLGAWVPVTFLLALVGILGREHVYPWITAGPPPGKEAWLSVGRMYWMDLGVLGALTLASGLYLYHSMRPTLHGVADHAEGRAKAFFSGATAGWRGQAEESARSARMMRILAPVICLLYAFGFSIIVFDQIMSLTPTWYSNLFGVFVSWGGFLAAVATTALLTVLHRNAPGLVGQITKARLHDLGKMIFAFSIFWMYLFWSQYLVIWYGNLPEETQFFAARLGPMFLVEQGNTGWFWNFSFERLATAPFGELSMLVWACCWIVPFWVLLGQAAKKTPGVLATVASVVVFGFWLEHNVLIWPSLTPNNGHAWIGGIQVGIALGFLGAFTLVYLLYSRVFPSLAVPDAH
jgi:hypothetical protein